MGNTIRKGCPQTTGLYIEGSVCGVKVWFTVDTGAALTIVSKRIFKKISSERIPVLEQDKDGSLNQADGTPLIKYGKARFRMAIGSLVKDFIATVADIQDDVLLGLDIGESVDILSTENKVIIDGWEIPCKVNRSRPSPILRKVVAADNYEVPPNSEMIVDIFVKHEESDQLGNMVIEPIRNVYDKHSILMASSIVDLGRCTAAVRVMNPSSSLVAVNQDMVLGCAERIDEDQILKTNLPSGARPRTPGIAHVKNEIRKEEKELTTDVTPQVPAYLEELYCQAIKAKSESERHQIANLLISYQEVFSKDDTDLGLTQLAEHEIDTGDAKPIRQPPRRVPIALMSEEKKAIDSLLQQGTIKESASPWASPIVLVRKKNGKIRCCVDYRRLNEVTRKDAYPIPRTTDCLDALTGSAVFSTLDMTSGYHQVPIKDSDKVKTAFATKYGLYEFQTMPFGLCNSPATFQRVMELALKGLQWQTCLIYLDDVIIFSPDFNTHVKRLAEVLNRMKAANVKLKPEKCSLFQEEVTFLGHIVTSSGVTPCQEKERTKECHRS